MSLAWCNSVMLLVFIDCTALKNNVKTKWISVNSLEVGSGLESFAIHLHVTDYKSLLFFILIAMLLVA